MSFTWFVIFSLSLSHGAVTKQSVRQSFAHGYSTGLKEPEQIHCAPFESKVLPFCVEGHFAARATRQPLAEFSLWRIVEESDTTYSAFKYFGVGVGLGRTGREIFSMSYLASPHARFWNYLVDGWATGYQIEGGNVQKTLKACAQFSESHYQRLCAFGIGRVLFFAGLKPNVQTEQQSFQSAIEAGYSYAEFMTGEVRKISQSTPARTGQVASALEIFEVAPVWLAEPVRNRLNHCYKYGRRHGYLCALMVENDLK